MCASVMHLTVATVATVLRCVGVPWALHGCVCAWPCCALGTHSIPTARCGLVALGATKSSAGRENKNCVCVVCARQVDEDDRPVDPPLIKSIEVLWNPFDDIVPRTTPQERQAQEQFK